jgi:L-amino acid N-acyltransferase YncA
MGNKAPIIDVTAENVDKSGFFCFMSKKKAPGYARKLDWLKARFDEGMKLKMLGGGARGFIEYIPGEYAWRPVEAKGYAFIHCLWVVGQSKGKGYGAQLLEECIRDARQSGRKGVAMVTSSGNWLASRDLLEKHGFESVAEAEPSFDLMALRFGKVRKPSFCGGWERKQAACGKGMTIFRTDQCPYIEDATRLYEGFAEETGQTCRTVTLNSCEEVRKKSPSAYGAFGVVLNGRLLSYSYLTRKQALVKINGMLA